MVTVTGKLMPGTELLSMAGSGGAGVHSIYQGLGASRDKV